MASQVTTAARKTVSFKSPYIGKTFQVLTEDIVGRDGLLSGGLATDNGAVITVAPFKMVSRGIIGETLANSVVDVPSGDQPWYVLASIPDDDPESGIVVQVTRSLQLASSGVVIASKSGSIWRNPLGVDVRSASLKAAEPGPEDGFTGGYDNTGGVYGGTDGTTVVEKIFANNGRLVTPEGVRLVTSSMDGESGKHLEITPRPGSPIGRRTDRIVLRQRESFSEEIAYLVGGTQEGIVEDSPIATGTSGVAPHYYAKRGGNEEEQWWAWGHGANLRIYGGIAAQAFGNTVLLTGTAITHVWFAGQRALDDALILLYIDNGNLWMVSFNAATGAIIDASTSIEALPNAINRASATIGDDELVHVVFEYDDGSEQQVYYTKLSSAAGTWAAVASPPNYVVGANSTFNDTKPLVEVCRNGIAHVVFLRGTGSNEFGDLVYARMDTSGSPIDSVVYASATSVADSVDQLFVDFSDGFEQVAYHSFTYISLTLTPHDELYVGLGAGRASQPPDQVLLFSPELAGRLGFPIVQIATPEFFEDGVSVVSDDAGEVILSANGVDGEPTYEMYWLGTQPGENSSEGIVIGREAGGFSGSVPTAPTFLSIGSGGELIYSNIMGTAIGHKRFPGIATNPYNVHSLAAKLHPNDLLLTVVDVDLHPTGGPAGEVDEDEIEIFQAKQKKSNYPIVVGKQGDYLGYGSLRNAVNAISKDGGGEVVLRGGHHFVGAQLSIPRNVSLLGENGAVIDGDVIVFGYRLQIDNVYGNIIETLPETDLQDRRIPTPGSWCLLDSGWHSIEKNLHRRESDKGERVLLANGIDGVVPSHTPATLGQFFPSGGRIENITIRGTLNTIRCHRYTFRNISIIGAASQLISSKNRECLFENIDMTQSASAGAAVLAEEGQDNTYKDMRFADGRGHFEIDHLENYPTLIGCRGDDTNPANDTYSLTGARTTEVAVVSCEGRFAATNIDSVVSNVGKLVRAPEGLGAIQFEDDNTMAGAGDQVPFSSFQTDGRKLPEGKGDSGSVLSILDALHIPEDMAIRTQGDQLFSGCIPALGTFPRMSVGAGEVLSDGKVIATASQDDTPSGATNPSQIYYWYLDAADTLQRRSDALNFSDPERVHVAVAITNAGNDGWDEFVDIRRFHQKPGHSRALTVSGGSGTGDFNTIQGALAYLETSGSSAFKEIVLLGKQYMNTGQDPIEINFQKLNPRSRIKSLVIRGIGVNAGIVWGQDSNLFNITGLASEAAATSSGQSSSIRFHNLLLESTNNTGPSSKSAVFNFTQGSYFTEISVDGCRTQSNSIYNWNMFANAVCDADIVTIAENTIEVRGVKDSGANRSVASIATDSVVSGTKTWTMSNGAFTQDDVDRFFVVSSSLNGNDGIYRIAQVLSSTQIVSVESPAANETFTIGIGFDIFGSEIGAAIFTGGVSDGGSIKNLYVHRNTIRADLEGAVGTTHGVNVGPLVERAWVTENTIENGRDDGQAFSNGMWIFSFERDGNNLSAVRWIVDNIITNTEVTVVDANEAITLIAVAGIVDSCPVYIVGNVVYDYYIQAVHDNGIKGSVKVIGNDFKTSTSTSLSMRSQCVVADNKVHSNASSSRLIDVGDGNSFIANNIITGSGGSAIHIDDGGADLLGCVVEGNVIAGTWSTAGIDIDRDDSVISNNAIENDETGGVGIKISSTTARLVIANNTIRAIQRGIYTLGSTFNDSVISGNRVLVTGDGVSNPIFLNSGHRNTITGNHFTSTYAVNATRASYLGCNESAIAGNYFGAYIGGSYGTGGGGQTALEVTGDNNAFSGNVLENRGTHTDKATLIILSTALANSFVGNTIRNIGAPGGGVHADVSGISGTQFGSTGSTLPGANKQSTA